MRFGLFIPQGWKLDLVGIDPVDQWAAMRAVAQRADAGPWDSLWVYDHFHTVPAPTAEATHEAWTLMAAFAACTSRIRLGQMCTCMGYREPTYLAKVAATVDIVSGGRVEMGIGGGWYEHEWRAYGYGFPSIGERLGRLDEGVQIMRQAWQTGTATLDGRYYRVDGAIVEPRPLQAGGIPLWIAGGGEKVTLRIAAKYAAYTNFAGDPEGFAAKSAILRRHCDDVGTEFDAIVRSAEYATLIAPTERELAARIDAVEARTAAVVGPDRAATWVAGYRDPHAIAVGTPDRVVERLGRMRELGLGYAIHYFPDTAYGAESVDLFEREVIPALS